MDKKKELNETEIMKEAIQEEIDLIEDRLVEIFNKLLDIRFTFPERLEGWKAKQKEINKLIKESEEYWKMMDYLKERVDNYEQVPLDGYMGDEGKDEDEEDE